jgi:hypothetical protein
LSFEISLAARTSNQAFWCCHCPILWVMPLIWWSVLYVFFKLSLGRHHPWAWPDQIVKLDTYSHDMFGNPKDVLGVLEFISRTWTWDNFFCGFLPTRWTHYCLQWILGRWATTV